MSDVLGTGAPPPAVDRFAVDDAPMLVADALSAIHGRVVAAVGQEHVGLGEADGRILAENMAAPFDLPPFANAAVDGYAVRWSDIAGQAGAALPVADRVPAGRAAAPIGPGRAVRIFTGAPVPPGFDTVAMQEAVRLDGAGRVHLPAGLVRGANLRQAGEDLVRGERALPAGRRLGPEDLGLLGALGVVDVPVRRRLRVALLSTGNELARPGAALGGGQRHDANRPMLAALLGRLGCRVSDLGILPDDADATRRALLSASGPHHDLILTSGGVSSGDEDHVGRTLAAHGSLAFWRLAVRPGRPVALGTLSGTPLVGLPGNPVAAFVTFALLARPLVARLAGETYRPPPPLPVQAGFRHAKKAGRREYLRARLETGPDGVVTARKHPRDGSGIITSLTRTDGLVELPEACTAVEPGDTLAFLSYASLR